MAKLPDPTDSLSPEDKLFFEELKKTRGGRIDGMYRSMLNNPNLTRHVGSLGKYLRFESSFPPDVREFVVLYVARSLNAPYEWVKHEPEARKAGLPDTVIESLRQGSEIDAKHSLYRNIIQAVKCVLNGASIPKELQDKLTEELTVSGLVELVVLAGFYRMISGVIHAFDVALPEGEGEPF